VNTVKLEEINRTIDVQSPFRTIELESNLREVTIECPNRTVDITMTYTLEEFYFVTPFEVIDEIKEGSLWSSE
jgi:hypothetical protein